MAESIEARVERAIKLAHARDYLWNERFRAGMRREGLRIAPASEAGETAVNAPPCVEGESYGWTADAVIVERDDA